ncbi:LPXTG cell wall anchor domain-containing protein [Sulfolobus sp. S-194]|uniref:LPXTG cell wall anchor domain-containing protein n=1 Tax=Sulfolobus sp. S-194 TaxID=2512240 RepID=UPI0014371E43|nr:LPXTG cell wall anchor domain-containing protein [Sulfolobus sp. S-194]QIW25071.1 LPXTG cell wall anchor domain-containing protein [Sulfolobus sp. S-194]
MKKLLLLVLISIALFTIVTNSYTLKIIVRGPVEVLVITNSSSIFLHNSTLLTFNRSVIISVSPLNPGYYVEINGTKYTEYTRAINSSETLNITAIPEFVKVSLNLSGSGKIRLTFSNGSSIIVNKSTEFYALNNSLLYIYSSKTMFINNVTTNFYILALNNNITLNITFLNNKSSSAGNVSNSQGFIGIGLGLIALSFYLFFKKRQQ